MNLNRHRLNVCFAPQACLLLLLLFSFSCRNGQKVSGKAVAPPAPSTSTVITNMTGSRTRVVWCQDVGTRADPGGMGEQLLLMGLDTADGRGERAILNKSSNYARPLLTLNGDRIIFSNRQMKKIFIVNWDGSDLRPIADGFALSVWLDPADGSEWLYFGTELPDSDLFNPIKRMVIDQPERVELVWDKTNVNSDNFQVSADGQWACGCFPWPACGVAQLPNIDWKRYGRGCWPSLAPGKLSFYWIFDGAHRNVTMFNLRNNKRWVVNISSAPGIDGHEVYHPRWSNHIRFIALTGPYKIAVGGNRIRGGGDHVEVYIGKFNDTFTEIEQWVKVSHNKHADYFPDVWIESAQASISIPTSNHVASLSIRSRDTWPGRRDGLVFAWDNRAAGNEIKGEGNQPARVCRAEPRGLARYGRNFEMDLTGGAFIADESANALLTGCKSSNQFSLEAVLTPKHAKQTGPARIISFSSGTNSCNFMLGQEGGNLVFRLRTSNGAKAPLYELCPLKIGVPNHVVVSYSTGNLDCYLNGVPVFADKKIKGGFGNWTPQHLVFGNEWNNGYNWSGMLEGIAIYQRAIGKEEAEQKAELYKSRLAGRGPVDRVMVEARLRQASGIPTPESISPYRRALAVNLYEVSRVVAGAYSNKSIMVAQWVILDGRVLADAVRGTGMLYRLTLEPFDSRLELEGERLIMDSDDFSLPLYYDAGN